MNERLIDLETRSAFLEKNLEELNGALIAQQRQLDRLEESLAAALRNLRSLTGEQAENHAPRPFGD